MVKVADGQDALCRSGQSCKLIDFDICYHGLEVVMTCKIMMKAKDRQLVLEIDEAIRNS